MAKLQLAAYDSPKFGRTGRPWRVAAFGSFGQRLQARGCASFWAAARVCWMVQPYLINSPPHVELFNQASQPNNHLQEREVLASIEEMRAELARLAPNLKARGWRWGPGCRPRVLDGLPA